ncbi:TPA: phage antirepressor KilAC domain-containing protein [Yersinia enterocolitica]|nr:phage antirepressor KilAC domain-containing protein [Yersinia enterocolitica]EKN3873981.1 phage antirepressor KilAC domain-containing protein [Yersinia enterocolitica]EKN3880776.1 phage antirepressor KilAC domain-containing protein [Yersinia enterocolitica]ELW8952484.1 phage antirepressor KilAC domain-containing protein [Yersinia enterocolitica]ELW8961619.1 phage antirepressor KilAC domain-containing protein [Yersinia enterocolitica]
MSSREIASLTGSNHSDVRRSIERLSEANLLSQPLADTPYINEQNRQTYYEYHLNKRDSLVVVVRLSPEFTAVVVDRWQELEHKSQVPQSLPEALRLAADLAEEKQQLENQLSIAAPKVEFVDRYVKANGSMTFRQVAKLLNAREAEFRQFLLDNHIMYRLNGMLSPHQQHSELGRFEVKTGTNTLNNHAFAQSRFTPKGVKWVGGLWAEYLAKKGAA